VLNKKFYLLGYNAMYSVESQPNFRRNISHASNQRESVTSNFFLLGSFFNPEDVGDMFLINVGLISTDCTALYTEI
jgi:hypothetical protein